MRRMLLFFASLACLCSFLLAARCGSTDKPEAASAAAVGGNATAPADGGGKSPDGGDIPAVDGDTLYNDQTFEPQPEEGESPDNGSAFSGGEGLQDGAGTDSTATPPN